MKMYNTLGDLLRDYRKFNKISQSDLASLMDVDIRTVIRWEKNETLIKSIKESDFVKVLNIPYQVIRNLNAANPIAIYYDLKKRTYSTNIVFMHAENASWYKSELPIENENIRQLSNYSDTKFITDIQRMAENQRPIKSELIIEASKILPELNLILEDRLKHYTGHVSIIPLKLSSYFKIRDREMDEGSLSLSDLSYHFTETPLVFYFYSLYADSLANTYILVNRILDYFKEKKFKNYIFAGITYRKQKVTYLKEMGLSIVWEDKTTKYGEFTFMEGNLNMFLFGKML